MNKFYKILKNIGKKMLIYTLLTMVVLVTLGYCCMEKMLFPAPKSPSRCGNITLVSGQFKLDALYVPPRDGQPTILFSHGNGEVLAQLKNLADEFQQRGYGFLTYDYAGYGASEGQAGEKQSYSDIKSAYDFLIGQANITPEKIMVVGFSVGTGPSTYIACTEKTGALVLAAPFASAIEVMLPFPLPGNRFCTAERLSKNPVPVLIFHGTADTIIPFRNAQKIYRQAGGEKKLIAIPNADHAIINAAGEVFWQELANWASEYVK